MSEASSPESMSLAPGVLDTIITLAAAEAKGVAAVEQPSAGGLRGLLAPKPAASGLVVEMTDEGKAQVELHLQAFYGHSLPEVADDVRTAVSDALLTQAGVETDRIDIFVDGIAFAA